MKLSEALGVIQQAPAGGEPWRAWLACGFSPLHLGTWVHACLQQRLAARRVVLETGLFGDVAGNIERALGDGPDAILVVVEWADLDQRLSLRSLGGWQPDQLEDIARTAGEALERIESVVRKAAERTTVVVSLPGLPVPPVAHTPGWQLSGWEAALRSQVAAEASSLAGLRGVKLVSAQRLDEVSPAAQRHDPAAELAAGFPYSKAHAAALAELLAELVAPAASKKGIITDLDDTLWAGLAGEIGPEAVRWDLEGHAQTHGLYQRLLSSLAAAGTLVAVASKNDPAVAERAFARPEMILKREQVFPLEVHWGAKSRSVAAILKAWNVGADSVVFVDDSPMELAEVSAAFPQIETMRFPGNDAAAAWKLVARLRDLFGKDVIREEDRLRLASLRQPVAPPASGDAGAFLAGLQARLQFQMRRILVTGGHWS